MIFGTGLVLLFLGGMLDMFGTRTASQPMDKTAVIFVVAGLGACVLSIAILLARWLP